MDLEPWLRRRAPIYTIYLIRHGETIASKRGLAAGTTDVPLARAGIEQMDAIAAVLKDKTLNAVFSSPLRRCAEPAREFAAARGLPHSEIMDFAEIDFGEWEGRAWDDIRQNEKETFAAAQSASPLFTFPGGENVDSFRRRVQTAFAQVLHATRGPAAIFAHAGTIRMILAGIRGITPAEAQMIDVPPASLSIIEPAGMGFKVMAAGSVDHLNPFKAPVDKPPLVQ